MYKTTINVTILFSCLRIDKQQISKISKEVKPTTQRNLLESI